MRRLIQTVSVLSALLLPALVVEALEDVSWGEIKSTAQGDDSTALPAAKKAGKVSICQSSGDGQSHVISVDGNAVASHFANHGDSYAGTYYIDADGDGYGNANGATSECQDPGFVDNSLDSDDADASINPDATEICGDGIDNNSNGQADEDCEGVCGPTDCTEIGGCFGDDYSDVLGELPDAIVNFVEGETFTTGSGACYNVPVGNTGGNVVTWVGPLVNVGSILSGAPGLLAIFGGGLTEGKFTTDLVTAPGATYVVSFDVRQIEFGGVGYPRHEITVSASDGGGVLNSVSALNPTVPSVTVGFEFDATGALTTLAVEGTILGLNPNQDIGFDNLVVTRVD